jgi:NAD(P)-dependent dehydrogenase (short-subunit alcohol dehydrogenase family)
MLPVNLTGAFLCSRGVLPTMIARRFGRIVNTGSQLGLKGGEAWRTTARRRPESTASRARSHSRSPATASP